ncbi:hypothetical protein DMA11_14300 [Marinilabiliaceae bacterium JC017]|nr:hypothetical protein DMA11_14300 [Marinilabiliaceae bacterium JC017]
MAGKFNEIPFEKCTNKVGKGKHKDKKRVELPPITRALKWRTHQAAFYPFHLKKKLQYTIHYRQSFEKTGRYSKTSHTVHAPKK